MTLSCLCSCGENHNPGTALNDAKRLAAKGDYEGALAKHIWFHDNVLAINPNYYGVRLSFALDDWLKLGQQYPKALQKLKNIRDEKTSRLIAGEVNRELFHDVQAINEHLDESQATVELFKRIEATNPAFAARIYDSAEEALLQAKEYGLAKKYLRDPMERLSIAKRNLESGMQFAKTSQNGESSRRAFESIFTQTVLRIIIILRETGDKELAKSIQTEALKTYDTASLRDALNH